MLEIFVPFSSYTANVPVTVSPLISNVTSFTPSKFFLPLVLGVSVNLPAVLPALIFSPQVGLNWEETSTFPNLTV